MQLQINRRHGLFLAIFAFFFLLLNPLGSSQAHADTGKPLSVPVKGRVSSEFGMRYHPIAHVNAFHKGRDLAASCGTPIKAPALGRVISAGWGGGYGNRTVISHGNVGGIQLKTTYSHQASLGVHTGQRVSRGQNIGRVGTTGNSTGCHLHFEVYADGKLVNPARYYGGRLPSSHVRGAHLANKAHRTKAKAHRAAKAKPKSAPKQTASVHAVKPGDTRVKPAAVHNPASYRPPVTLKRRGIAVVRVSGLNVRNGPTTRRNRPVAVLARGTRVSVYRIVRTPRSSGHGTTKWALVGDRKWVWAGGLSSELPKTKVRPSVKRSALHGTRRLSASSRSVDRRDFGSPKDHARALLKARGWGNQFGCLNSLINRESGWRVNADNPTSSAYGIPQAMPGSKMASAGSDWRTNPRTQLRWMMSYLASRYGNPCKALAHSRATNWY